MKIFSHTYLLLISQGKVVLLGGLIRENHRL